MVYMNTFKIALLSLWFLDILASPTTQPPAADLKCCEGSMPEGWSDGGFCCSDGAWHRGDASSAMCADINLEDSLACPTPSSSPIDGCRAPDEFYKGVSCESCCDQNLADCQEHSGEEWYNQVRNLFTPDCPSACPKCASCFKRDEETLLELTPPAECNPLDCPTMVIGVDPCFARGSCECFCETANILLEKCPQVKPEWLPIVEKIEEVVPEEGLVRDDGSVLCPGLLDTQLCDCAKDCEEQPTWCSCKHAFECCVTPPSTLAPEDCTIDVARGNKDNCPLAKCAVPDKLPGCNGPIEMVEKLDSENSACCLKLCNFQCVADTETILNEGDECCDYAGNMPNPFCTTTCGEGLECVFYGEELGPPTCKLSQNVIETVTWTMQGPWDLKKMQDESASLVRVFAYTLGVSPFSTILAIVRDRGIVNLAFTTTAPSSALQRLNDRMFKRRFEANVLQMNEDLGIAMFINQSEMMAFFVLEGPWSISAVEDYEESLLAQFSYVLRLSPDQIEEEITTNNKMTQVIYKVKGSNPQQIAPLYDGAAFSRKLHQNIVQTNPALAAVFGWGSCPVNEPTNMGPCVGSLTCEYGQECCCGNCFPSMMYMCNNGFWISMFTDACLGGCGAMPKQGILRAPEDVPQHKPEASLKPNYTRVVLVVMFAVILGICAGLLTKRLVFKKKASVNDLTDDLYHDISLDTQEDLARSV